MSLAPLTRLGPYEIVAPAGSGGMGEVYRARDTRLNREVAIKILPAAFSRDPERLRRFQHEAQAVAALNHPNILAIHDFGDHEGSPYIVTEFLEGETLRQRLDAGAILMRKTIEYAQQIARGLAAAHDKGIVHRDLKPENIFVTRDGRVKILDFGLAKIVPETANPDAATLAFETEPGVVMGTVGYMSPEQVKGRVADHRADLFSFGTILYEMLSGKRAFAGDSSVEIMNAILKEDPPNLTEANRNLPPMLERLVYHCLEKSPEERFRSAHDVAFDLTTLAGSSGATAEMRPPDTSTRRRAASVAGVAAALAVLAGSALFMAGKRNSAPVLPPHFRRVTFERGSVLMARFSADGQSVIYDAAWGGKPPHLFSTPASGPEPRALDLENANLFAVSRSGEAALGLGGRMSNHLMVRGATLARSPLSGGAPRELLHDVMAADWAPDGTLAVAHYTEGRMRLEYPIGKVLYETSGWISDIRFSPAGDKIAFLDHRSWPDDRGWVAMVDLAGNARRLSAEWGAEDGLAWAPDGKEIWFTAAAAGIDRSIMAVTLSGKHRRVLSIPGTLRLYDIYSDGRILLSAGHERVDMIGTTSDDKTYNLSWSGWTVAADISADGKRVLFDEQSEFAGTNYIVAVRTVDGSPPLKLGEGEIGRYSADGKFVSAVIHGQSTHFALLPTGTGEPKEVLVEGLELLQLVDFMPDGNLILAGAERGHGRRCYTRPLAGGPLQAITREGSDQCRTSPDSRRVVAEDITDTIWTYEVDGREGRLIPGTESMVPIRWADNRSILAFRKAELPARVFLIDVVSGNQRVLKALAPGDRAGVSQLLMVAGTADGRTFAYSYQQVLYDLYVVEGLK